MDGHEKANTEHGYANGLRQTQMYTDGNMEVHSVDGKADTDAVTETDAVAEADTAPDADVHTL